MQKVLQNFGHLIGGQAHKIILIEMKKLNAIRQLIEEGKFPKTFPEFGGANLIITKNKNRNFHEGDVMVYSEHAPALSWLVTELAKIYNSEIDYLNKYDFYPSIGKLKIGRASCRERV